MSESLGNLIPRSAERAPDTPCLSYTEHEISYATAATTVAAFASALVRLGIERLDRVAVYLPKQPESVYALLGTSLAGCVFVPINPLLKSAQVAHILKDCGAKVLVTSSQRAAELCSTSLGCNTLLPHLIVVDGECPTTAPATMNAHSFTDFIDGGAALRFHRVIDVDIAAIFYTSGSTGKPKGVVLSHRNLIAGASSVSQYLNNTNTDRLLAVLPLSFDYGFSQLTTAFLVGASVDLMEYLVPRDVIIRLAKKSITGLAGVPSLWHQLAVLEWPADATKHLRYITNSGGTMPTPVLQRLRASLPKVEIFLMYGLTEAFRSTYLPPSELDRRPNSIGKAIPNAEVMVVRPDGMACEPNEPGELVHRGALVSLGYWNDPEKTAERFKPSPASCPALVLQEMAVWSGDTVKMDEDGFLYFIGRRDEMIKTSGYRVSPSEVEDVVFSTGMVVSAAAIGIPHPGLGQAIIVVAKCAPECTPNSTRLIELCRQQLPSFMLPQQIVWRDVLPCNANGKFDRLKLAAELADLYATGGTLK